MNKWLDKLSDTQQLKSVLFIPYLNIHLITTNIFFSSFGKLCVLPNQKWNGLFRQCIQQIGIPDSILTPLGNHIVNVRTPISNKKVWQNVAVSLSHANKDSSIGYAKSAMMKSTNLDTEQLNMIPTFGQSTLTLESFNEIKIYLNKVSRSI